MPIVQPPSLDALGLVSFQINPHYIDSDPASRHMGETRETRIKEFHEENSTPVVGLREGAMLRVRGSSVELRGQAGARIFRRGKGPVEVVPPASITDLLVSREPPAP
jgi:dipeptidase E